MISCSYRTFCRILLAISYGAALLGLSYFGSAIAYGIWRLR